MKIFIQSNKFQYLVAKVAKYSFERFGHSVEIMDFEQNDFLKNKINYYILRRGKKTPYYNDLQSFTLLRFLAPELNNYNDKILIIDPDIFALKNPNQIIQDHPDTKDISCVFYNDIPRSEMMLIDARKIKWKFTNLMKDLFDFKIDYIDLMNLNFDPKIKINELDKKYNSHDIIRDDTVLLHTTNRITQPWKENLDINFQRYNVTHFQLLKENIKKILNRNYNKEILSKKFLKHPEDNVRNVIKKLFLESIEMKYITHEEVELEIKNKNISEKILI